MTAQPNRGRQRQRMARTRLLLGGRNDPDIVAELARDRLEKLQAPSVHAIVIGNENPHGRSLCGSRSHAATANSRTAKCAIFATAWRFLHVAHVASCEA